LLSIFAQKVFVNYFKTIIFRYFFNISYYGS